MSDKSDPHAFDWLRKAARADEASRTVKSVRIVRTNDDKTSSDPVVDYYVHFKTGVGKNSFYVDDVIITNDDTDHTTDWSKFLIRNEKRHADVRPENVAEYVITKSGVIFAGGDTEVVEQRPLATPPTILRGILLFALPFSRQDALMGDLEEVYNKRVGQIGRGWANAWYLWQVIRETIGSVSAHVWQSIISSVFGRLSQ